MAKQGMKQPERTHVKPRNDMPPVPEIQGKAKAGHQRTNPIIPGTEPGDVKVFRALKGDGSAAETT